MITPLMLRCPLCRRRMVCRVLGAISALHMTPNGRLERRLRPGSFWACCYCEWAAEERPERS
jgi:hypothetical protein